MKTIILLLGILFLVFPASSFAEETAEPSGPRLFFLPGFSYNYLAFEGVNIHNPSATITMVRVDPMVQDKMLILSLGYSPVIFDNKYRPHYPDMFHQGSVNLIRRDGRHSLVMGFMPRTEKPVFGGYRSFTGMAMYSYSLIQGDHFSMGIGAGLLLMDFGITMNDGTPWMLWPIPVLSLSWKYEWVELDLTTGAKLTIGPKKPFSFILEGGLGGYDAALWYNNESMGLGLGVKSDREELHLADGRRYRLGYNALYGAVKLFGFLEIKSGWAFEGKEGERQMSGTSLFRSLGRGPGYDRNLGSGFFVSISGSLM